MTPEPTPSQELEEELRITIQHTPAEFQIYTILAEEIVKRIMPIIKQHELSRKQEWVESLEAEIRRHALTVFDVDDETLVPIEQVFKIIKEQSKE